MEKKIYYDRFGEEWVSSIDETEPVERYVVVYGRNGDTFEDVYDIGQDMVGSVEYSVEEYFIYEDNAELYIAKCRDAGFDVKRSILMEKYIPEYLWDLGNFDLYIPDTKRSREEILIETEDL